jgi:hypothetical protein
MLRDVPLSLLDHREGDPEPIPQAFKELVVADRVDAELPLGYAGGSDVALEAIDDGGTGADFLHAHEEWGMFTPIARGFLPRECPGCAW